MHSHQANYELLKYASMTSNVPAWLARQSAWQSQVCTIRFVRQRNNTTHNNNNNNQSFGLCVHSVPCSSFCFVSVKDCRSRRLYVWRSRYLVGMLQPHLRERKLRSKRSTRPDSCPLGILHLGPNTGLRSRWPPDSRNGSLFPPTAVAHVRYKNFETTLAQWVMKTMLVPVKCDEHPYQHQHQYQSQK